MSIKPVFIALSVMAALLVSAPTATAVDQMSERRAGNYYLRWICPQNDAGARLQRVMFRGKRIVHHYELTGLRLRQTKRAARAVANTQFTAARRFNNPPAAWPREVRQPVRRLSRHLLVTAGYYRNMSFATNGRQVLRPWNRLGRVLRRQGNMPARSIRARLNLPAPGRGCGR